MKKLVCLLLCGVMALSMAGCNDKNKKQSQVAVISHNTTESKIYKYNSIEEMKIAFLYIGSIFDGGFNQNMDKARISLEQKGYSCVYKDNVPDNDLCEKEIINFIENEGANVVVLTTYNYMTYAKKLASIYPDVCFIQYSEEPCDDNLSTFSYASYELKYLLGIAAGSKAVETGNYNIGYVAPVEIAYSYRDINAFTLGVKSVCPDAVVYLGWTNYWGDEQEERNCALKLINDYDCSIMCYSTDTKAVAEVCEETRTYIVAADTEVKTYAPSTYLAVADMNFENHIVSQVEKFTADGWEAESYLLGLSSEGNFSDVSASDISAENTLIAVNLARNKIKNNEFEVFDGKITDNKGLIKVEADKTLSKADISSMNWLVEGVIEI